MLSTSDQAMIQLAATQLVDDFLSKAIGELRHLPAKSQLYSFLQYAQNYSPDIVMDEFVIRQRERALKAEETSRNPQYRNLAEWYGMLQSDYQRGRLAQLAEAHLPPEPEKPKKGSENMQEELTQYKQARKHWQALRAERLAKLYPLYARHVAYHMLYNYACIENSESTRR